MEAHRVNPEEASASGSSKKLKSKVDIVGDPYLFSVEKHVARAGTVVPLVRQRLVGYRIVGRINADGVGNLVINGSRK